ncbi:hypothetical protein CNBE2780 [Cryptococcus deneoformans B-3501A]|uniref:hypothetical protein n=1 Tax=Cryptococcus deneoformans (strain B-3501A) TaxID=283643 RepID=UPI00004302D0|nr:hypothetical protein CNBE2780 [Cryptococcus neoformans var. neoformans B-3501A]EAL20917.1 hypothetical protein CNBE2780 [Cryptococcus neoformans var. neoformans B-3501A]
MDIDPPVYNTDRLDAFVYKHNDGPARKRLHTELEHQPFHPQPTQGFAQFNSSLNSAPLLLAALNTPKKAPAYDPSQWYSQGARTPATSLVTQEVDMDSPARRGPSSEAAGSVDEPEKGGEAEDKENATEEKKPRKFAKGAVTRTNRKRQQSKKEQVRSDNEDRGAVRHSDSATPAFTKSEHHYSVHMAAPSLRHSEIPALLLGYLQFFVNTSIVLFCIYLAILFVLTVRRDVKDKMNEYSVEILQEIAECTNMYLTNMCSSNRIPHMDAPCRAWEACMNRDPTVVGRINIIAETFAGVINSFVEPISWKTMSFTLVTLTFLVILTNSALFNLRARASQHDTSAPAAPAFWPPHGQFMPQLPANMPQAPTVHALGEGGERDARQIGWRGEKGKGW